MTSLKEARRKRKIEEFIQEREKDAPGTTGTNRPARTSRDTTLLTDCTLGSYGLGQGLIFGELLEELADCCRFHCCLLSY